MSVATRNPFSVLEAEGASRPSSPVPNPSAAPSSAPSASRGSQQTRTGPRGGQYYSRGSGVKKASHRDANATADGGDEPAAGAGQRRYENRDDGHRGGEIRGTDSRGRGRGGRGGGARGGRRQFDRHSQTGKSDSDKKIHQSWGGDDGNVEFNTEQQATVDAALEGVTEWGADSAPAADWGAPQPHGATESVPPVDTDKVDGGRPRKEREPEEEDNTLTLDQYHAQQKEQESVVPKTEKPRQANEGADENLWKGVVPLSKEEATYFAGKTKSTPKIRAKKEEKVFLEIGARFDRPERGGRGRGRAVDRGNSNFRGHGAGRGDRQPVNFNNFDVDDKSAFPSLT